MLEEKKHEKEEECACINVFVKCEKEEKKHEKRLLEEKIDRCEDKEKDKCCANVNIYVECKK